MAMSFMVASLEVAKKLNLMIWNVWNLIPGFSTYREMVPIVTIDGPSGSGKGTIAKALA